jgi:hypothetical protein
MPPIPNLEAILQRGVAVHEWTAQVDEGDTVRPPAAYEGYCEAYRSACYALAPSWTQIEQPFCNGRWHGIIDRVGYLKGFDPLVIADLKTGMGAGKDAQQRIATQLACYAMGWKPEQYTQVMRVGIYLHKDGAWHTQLYDDPRDFDRWLQLLAEANHGKHRDSETLKHADRESLDTGQVD